MKKILMIALLFCACKETNLFAQLTPLAPADFEKKIQTIQPQILDVRTSREYQSSHMKNALQADWMNMQQFTDRVQYLDKSKPVYVYCASGGRSAEAAKWLQEHGFADVQDLKGGLSLWKMEGRSVETVATVPQMTTSKYTELSRSSGIVLVDFGAEWCPPCKKMEPVIQQLQNDLPGNFSFVKVDGGNDIDVMKTNKVEAIPTFIIYKKGKEVWRKQGIVDIEELKKMVGEK